jgi:hypothetical protein
MLLLYLRILAVASTERSKDAYGVLKHDPLGISFADSLGFHAVGAYWLLFTALDPALSTSYKAWSTRKTYLQRSATYLNSRSWFVSWGVGGDLTVRLRLPQNRQQ